MSPLARTAITVLLRLLAGDEQEAAALIDQRLDQAGRSALVAVARRLADLADDSLRCPHCGRWAPETEALVLNVLHTVQRWHRSCRDADLEYKARQGDPKARALLRLKRQAVDNQQRRQAG